MTLSIYAIILDVKLIKQCDNVLLCISITLHFLYDNISKLNLYELFDKTLL